MRICFIDASTATMTGGTDSVVYGLCSELAARHEVLLVTGLPKDGDILPHMADAPFTVLTVPFVPRTSPRCENLRSRLRLPLVYDVEALTLFLGFMRSRSVVREVKRCDVASLHYPTTALLFSRYLRMKGVPSVVHASGPFGAWAYRHAKCRLIVANSHDTRQQLEKTLKRPVAGTVQPGVAAAPVAPERACSRDPVLLSVGRITRAKGAYRLLHILRHLCEEMPAVRLVMVGRNYEGEALVREIERLELVSRVELAGELPYTRVAEAYRSADVLVHAPVAESFGMVVLEAQSNGLPVVAADMPSIREATGGHAVLLPWRPDEEWPDELYKTWAREIATLLGDGSAWLAASREGASWARTQTWQQRAAEYEVFLEEAAR
jgi:glycosyltransferase involved in cell wall biosynthesis